MSAWVSTFSLFCLFLTFLLLSFLSLFLFSFLSHTGLSCLSLSYWSLFLSLSHRSLIFVSLTQVSYFCLFHNSLFFISPTLIYFSLSLSLPSVSFFTPVSLFHLFFNPVSLFVFLTLHSFNSFSLTCFSFWLSFSRSLIFLFDFLSLVSYFVFLNGLSFSLFLSHSPPSHKSFFFFLSCQSFFFAPSFTSHSFFN